jgi:hypothetical protein
MCGNPSLLLAVLLLIVASGGGPAAPPKDAQGDPLPAGAVARLGSNRFRTSGGVQSLAFGPKDRTLLAHARDTVLVWDRKTGKELRRFAVPDSRASAFSPGAKILALLVSLTSDRNDLLAGRRAR